MKRIVLFVAVMAVSCGHGIDYSDGSRTGIVTKFSHKGLICRTWEGEMVMGGLRQTDSNGTAANVWQFTVDRSDLVDKVKEALNTGAAVKLTYHQGQFTGPCTSDSGYFVVNVESLSRDAKAVAHAE